MVVPTVKCLYCTGMVLARYTTRELYCVTCTRVQPLCTPGMVYAHHRHIRGRGPLRAWGRMVWWVAVGVT